VQKILLALLILVAISGCAKKESVPGKKEIVPAKTFPDAVELTANELSKELYPYTEYKILFTSFVNLNDFSESSNFGRLFAESLISQIKQRGYEVVEYRGTEIVAKSQKGEFRLNRTALEKVKGEKLLIVVGTYAKMDNHVFVNTRVIERKTKKVIAAATVYIPLKKKKSVKKATKDFIVRLVPSKCEKGQYCWREINE